MENYEGDLSDVVRAAADGGGTSRWQFPRNTVNYNYYSSDQDLGHPFSYIRDPLVPNIDTAPLSELLYAGGGMNSVVDDEIKRPANIFSRMLQISPTAKQQQPLSPCEAQAQAQRGLKPSSILVSNNNYSGSLISPTTPGLQISSPRNTARRKSQAKKVVCIPAPAPANSRATGEIVPSDLWAWRKYGQKPIKGSPYPRGYYRCSSSKGCLARKQVERSRTDPNMLVITYTSEHNHPWPTQRNALAGSTRSQSSKNSNNAAKDSSPTEKLKHMETSSTLEENSGAVKEETDKELENQFEAESNEGFKPTLADSSSNHDQDSFFEDLGEIGDDPMNLFEQGFPRDDLDPFTFYDWATNGSVIAATSKESNRHS